MTSMYFHCRWVAISKHTENPALTRIRAQRLPGSVFAKSHFPLCTALCTSESIYRCSRPLNALALHRVTKEARAVVENENIKSEWTSIQDPFAALRASSNQAKEHHCMSTRLQERR
eukprot:16462-Heterococcus_DN1.PRE.1